MSKIYSFTCTALSSALEKLKEIIAKNEADGKYTVVFCEDRLTLAAERTICAAVGGTFRSSVFTFARFLSSERGKRVGILSAQGSAMAIRRIIEENKQSLKLFGKFSAAAAAGAVYDTLALLYSSKISAEDVGRAAADGLLESKLHDISFIYSAYGKYLEENGKTDRNAYLGELPAVIENSAKIARSEVVFLGFQSFTRSALECVKAAFSAAKSVSGLFIGGKEEIYVNEGATAFEEAAKEFGGAQRLSAESALIPEAEALRKSLFNAESYFSSERLSAGNVFVYEAEDEEDELEFIAANIKKHVIDGGERYAKISVMLPDVASAERDLNRVFSQYRIPYYADRRHKLSEHRICAFITDYLNCAVSGCSFKDIDGLISSPLFPAADCDKDNYRNYALRLANFRGGIKREPLREIVESKGFDYEAVLRVREIFLNIYGFIPSKPSVKEVCGAIRKMLAEVRAEAKLKELAESFKDCEPTAAQFSARVYEAALSVIDEAEDVTGGGVMPLKEFIKILKSGFDATEVSLIPPKADAVFVGGLAATANTGSNVVFAAGLTGKVPADSDDTALLTDREIAALSRVNVVLSPKIRQVNARRREFTALNICAFRKNLYLTYPVRSGGEEAGASEIISYAKATFVTAGGKPLRAITKKMLFEKTAAARSLPYYCSEKIPALKRLTSDFNPEITSSVYSALESCGYGKEAEAAVSPARAPSLTLGRQLFVTFGSVSPTALETYFTCPYRNFIQQGLKLQEREEGALRPLDTGNFIHSVLQRLAPEMNGLTDAQFVRSRAEQFAEELLKTPAYAALTDSKSGEYNAAELIKEAAAISVGAFEQINNSEFRVENTETKCALSLGGGLKVGGRIDRVDSYGDMVRIIDYKTGTVSASPADYYMGLKLQLPLYLSAAADGRRAVGAYYFPASLDYKSKADGIFRLQGFMDGTDEAVKAADKSLEPKKKSEYVDAYLSGKKKDTAMDGQTFADFISYSRLVAGNGAREMLEGNIAPSPAEDACKYCKAGGSCGFAAGTDGAERTGRSIKCAEIADIARRNKGD